MLGQFLLYSKMTQSAMAVLTGVRWKRICFPKSGVRRSIFSLVTLIVFVFVFVFFWWGAHSWHAPVPGAGLEREPQK